MFNSWFVLAVRVGAPRELAVGFAGRMGSAGRVASPVGALEVLQEAPSWVGVRDAVLLGRIAELVE